MKKSKSHVLSLPMYEKEIFWGIGQPFVTWLDEEHNYTKFKNSELNNGGLFWRFTSKMTGEHTYCIWFNEESVTDLRVIWHESLHAAVRILSDVGIPISLKNDESMCYLQGHIALKLMDIINPG